MSQTARRIAENVAGVRERIADAARRSGRSPQEVTLVAVTKYVGASEARALADAGCLDLGESRPQELWRKAEQLADASIRWHQVGPLQRNKAKRTIPLLFLLHSADSRRLLDTIEPLAAAHNRRLPLLLEVNISAEPAKHGFAPAELAPLLEELPALRCLEVRGLMTMARLGGDAEGARRDFACLRQLRDRLRGACPPGVSLDELSMGMSGDFEAAIEEGATIVRVGSALFQGLLDD